MVNERFVLRVRHPQEQLAAVAPILGKMRPWTASSNTNFCKNVVGSSTKKAKDLRDQVNAIREDLVRFQKEQKLDRVVMVNVASTERPVNLALPQFATPEAFEAAIDANDTNISPAMLYAFAAVSTGIPFANFTPSVAADVPASTFVDPGPGQPLPVLVSTRLLEIYNNTFAPARKLPRLSPEMLQGFLLPVDFNRSYVTAPLPDVAVITTQARVVGASDRALLAGITLPLDVAVRLNR